MRFLRTKDGGLVNASHIVRIVDAGKGVGGSIATLTNGQAAHFHRDVEEIGVSFYPIIPAAPGYVLLQYYLDIDGSDLVMRLPVASWRINPYGVALPLVTDEIDDGGRTGVLQPDGQVVEAYNSTHDDEAAWLASVRRQAIKQRDETRKPAGKDANANAKTGGQANG